MSRPSNTGQFERTRLTVEDHKRIRQYYFGSCGPDQDFWPKDHRWGRWRTRTIAATGARLRERICLTCSLVSDPVYLEDQS